MRRKDRDIHLSNWGVQIVERLFDHGINKISRISWKETLVRAAKRAENSTEGIMPKITRKTWESWLVACYPSMTVQIALSQGHDTITAMKQYLNISFTPVEKEDMKKYVNGFCGVMI